MRSKGLRLLSMLVVLALVLVSAATATAQPPYPVSDGSDEATPAAPARPPARDIAKFEAKRWIVQLADAPLAKYEGGVGAMKATAIAKTGEAKLDVEKADSKAYIAYLEGKQKAFAGQLSKAAPGAKVERSYQILFNGLAVAMSAEQAKAVSQLPGVAAVTPEQRYEMHMFSSLDLIGAPTLWGQVGGQANAGAGVKVAVIDSGIYVKYDANGQYAGNACFTDEGYTMPAGYPKGDTRFTNNKVIVARNYVRSYDPPIEGEDTPIPGTPDAISHGTHVAGTVACNAGTQATVSGLTLPISGVAPRAYLMNYKVFYLSQNPDWSGSFLDAEGIQALEDAVRDGADVINNSWGSNATLLPMTGPIDRALDAAAAAGVVVVHSNGNNGPDRATTGQASTAPQSISVAASTKGSTIAAGFVDVVAPAPVPANLTGRAFGSAQFGPPITSLFGPHPYVPIQTVDTSGSDLACGDPSTTIPAGSLTGKVALISRGVCNFSLKVWNAQQAGAIGAVIYNNAANGETIITMAAGARAAEVTIPSIHVARSMGLGMIAHYTAHPDQATVQVDPGARVIPSTADQVIGFSSRGPTTGLTLKPDVAAPGVSILSSGYGEGENPFTGFGAVSGTSMAAPHVAGAAALLKQLHPTWRPWQIKSALMTTAKEEMTTIDGSPAGVLDRGAGRIDLTKAGNPGVVVDMPSLSGGRMTAGASQSFTVRVQDVSGAAGTWAVSTVETAHGEHFDITVEPTTLNLAANGTANLTVRLATMAAAPSGDYEGSVVLVNSTTGVRAHLPVWLRVLPAAASKDVLLVDDDGSSIPNAGLANYSQVYTETLQTLGLSYDYLDITQDAFPSLFDLYDYKAVVVFTGDNDSFNTSGFFAADQNALSEWLDSGGRLLYTGQNLAETIDEENTGERLYEGNFGVKLATDDVFGGPAPRPSANGVGPMAGLTLDLSPGGDGAGNQTSVEAMRVISDTIGYNAATTILPLFRPIGGNAPADTAIAYSRSFEPSLEQPALEYLYRGVILGFGLEGVNSNTGSATRTQVADRALDWLLDTTTVSVNAASGQQYSAVNLTASATSSAGATITAYRWDFGDGSPIMSSTSATASHTYRAAGSYTVRVEVTNSLGHRAIGTGTVTVAPFACDPRNPSHLCNGILAVRAFIDFGCDTFFNRGTDWPLAGTTLRATLPDGTVRTSIVDMNGNATFNGLTLPDGGTVTISVDDPPLPTWARPQGYELTECPGVTTSVTVNRGTFSANFNVGYLDLRYHFTQP